ncbi:MAG TPA: PqqD family protein [Pyrinomonadaceae bacterium]|nr:PqqD family protein [Pyrinomonadaceae bacterium]
MSTEQNLAPHEHVVATELDGGEGVLVDLNTKRYYQLNETAMFVWKRLEKGIALARIVEEMTSVYDVTAEHAHESVRLLLHNLQTRKLVGNRG